MSDSERAAFLSQAQAVAADFAQGYVKSKYSLVT